MGVNMRVMVWLLVVIYVINHHSIGAFKRESHSPVAMADTAQWPFNGLKASTERGL